MPQNTPATTRPFTSVSMPIDILRINPKTYNGFVGIDAQGNQLNFPTYQSAVQAGVKNIGPNLKQSINHQSTDQTPKSTKDQNLANNPTEVDKYIQTKIDESKKLMNGWVQNPTPEVPNTPTSSFTPNGPQKQ